MRFEELEKSLNPVNRQGKRGSVNWREYVCVDSVAYQHLRGARQNYRALDKAFLFELRFEIIDQGEKWGIIGRCHLELKGNEDLTQED